MGEAAGGIHQVSGLLSVAGQRQGDGIDRVIAPSQIGLQAVAIAASQVDGPAPQHQTGDAVLDIEHHAAAAMAAGQLAGEADGVPGHHQIEVGLGLEPAQ